jgi:uncharacterized delta-60 repeat protein
MPGFLIAGHFHCTSSGGTRCRNFEGGAMPVPQGLRVVVGRSYTRRWIERLEQRTLLSGGDLDPTFGVGGKVTTPVSFGGTPVIAVAGNSHAKIVVAAQDGNGMAVLRYLPGGGLDSSFGTGGQFILSLLGAKYDPRSMALQSDNSVIIGGHFQSGSTSDAFLLRLTSSGLLDSTFGTHGIRLFHFGGTGSTDSADAVAVLSSGKILAATSGFNFEDSVFMAERFNSNGKTDTTFGTAGIGTVDFGSNETNILTSLSVQSTGKIILGGEYMSGGKFGARLARLNANGTKDSTFSQGSSTFNQSFIAGKSTVQSNDKIVVIGDISTGKAFGVERYNANGSIDTTFNGIGHAATMFGKLSVQANGVVVQPNGSIIVAGTVGSNMEVLRYLSSGGLDSSFGPAGRAIISFGSASTGTAVALQSSGRILVAGKKGSSVAVVRLLGDHTLLGAGATEVMTGVTPASDPSLAGMILTSQTVGFSVGGGSSTVDVKVFEWVFEETASHTLDFYYRIGVLGGSSGAITSLLASNFKGFTTYVDYRTDLLGPLVAPVTASRSSDSKSITFNFIATPTGNGVVGAGMGTYELLIKTNALHFNSLGKIVLNGGTMLGGYEPTT